MLFACCSIANRLMAFPRCTVLLSPTDTPAVFNAANSCVRSGRWYARPLSVLFTLCSKSPAAVTQRRQCLCWSTRAASCLSGRRCSKANLFWRRKQEKTSMLESPLSSDLFSTDPRTSSVKCSSSPDCANCPSFSSPSKLAMCFVQFKLYKGGHTRMLSIILISFSQGAFPFSAASTLRTFDSRAAEDCGFTSLPWMSLSSFITFDRFSSNSPKRSRYSPITSSCELTTPCNYCSFREFSCRRRWNSAGVGSGSGCAVSFRERCSSVSRRRASASCQFSALICYRERVSLCCMFEWGISINRGEYGAMTGLELRVIYWESLNE